MNRMTGVIWHTLGGSSGWAGVDHWKLDVGRIVSTGVRKRVWCFFDRDLPWSLDIYYYQPEQSLTVLPALNFRSGPGVAFGWRTDLEKLVTRRFASEKEIKDEISKIVQKQKDLDTLAHNLRESLKK